MNKQRPVNLDLTTIKFPMPAIVSILHRISGLVLFLFIPFILWMLRESLRSEQSFNSLQMTLSGFVAKIFLWLFLIGLLYHLVAGIRHLLMDMHVGESLAGGRLGAKIVLGLAIILAVLAGVWLWW